MNAMNMSSPALESSEREELLQAAFSEDEITAVAQSVAASMVLAVKSFVDEVNDNTPAPGGAIRRESHGKQQGCLRAQFEVTADSSVGVFRAGASYPAWIRLSN